MARAQNATRADAQRLTGGEPSPVIPGEDLAAYEALVREYYDNTRTHSPVERFHLDTMICADWQQRRLARVETDLYSTLLSENPGASLATALLSDSPTARLLARIQRQLAELRRAWYRAHTELQRAGRRAEEAGRTEKTGHKEGYDYSPPALERPEVESQRPKSRETLPAIFVRRIQVPPHPRIE